MSSHVSSPVGSPAGAAIGAPEDVARALALALGLAADADETADAPGAGVVGSDATGTVCIDVPAARWHDAVAAARAGSDLDMLDWLSAVDEPDADPPGVDLVAHLVCTRSAGARVGSPGMVRLLLRTRLTASAPSAPSVTDLYPGAAWHERETHEMFGVDFAGFDDGSDLGLRPLLLPDGFEGTPLRKSFVLAARVSKPWPGAKEPGESDAHAAPARRRTLPPGVPDATWGPRDA